MPTIYLCQKEGKYQPGSVNVTEEPYPVCDMYHRYKHQPTGQSWLPLEYIKLYKGTNSTSEKSVVLYITLEYPYLSLDYVNVYFNIFDSKNVNPLIIVLFFKVGTLAQSRYYKFSDLYQDKYTSKTLDSLNFYTNEEGILTVLIQENLEINGQLRFRIGISTGTASVKQYEDRFDNFTRVTFLPNTDIFQSGPYPGIYELYSSNLFKHGKNQIDPNVFKQFNDLVFLVACVYYYSKDTTALLVEFITEFRRQYIRRTKSFNYSKWVKEKNSIKYSCNEELSHYLKIILLGLQNKIIIRLDNQDVYTDNKVVDNVTSSSPRKYNNKKIDPTKNCGSFVNQFDGYICYNHDLTSYYNSNFKKIVDDLKSLCITNFDFYLELNFLLFNYCISIFDSDDQQFLFYNPGSGPPGDNVCVYFSLKGNETCRPDTVPLMLKFNGKYYKPKDFNSYLTVWIPIQIEPISGVDENITKVLNETNKSLNQIDLVKNNNYGISNFLKSPPIPKEFESKSERVEVTCVQIKPTLDSTHGIACVNKTSASCENGVYSKYIHKTVNEFEIGKIMYRGQVVNVEKNGEKSTNGEKPITVQQGKNEVEVYYMTTDSTLKFPLLIGIGKQDSVKTTEKVAEYYKLISTSPPSEYKWQKDSQAFEKVKNKGKCLVEYLNGINYANKKIMKVEINKKSKYDAVGMTPSKSNGASTNGLELNQNGVVKNIMVEECVECLKVKDSRYRCYIQGISGKSSSDYNSIGGVAFYIPSKLPTYDTSPGKNGKEIILHNIKENFIEQATGQTNSDGSQNSYNGSNFEQYKHIYYNNCMGDLYVYFYGDDPRPGLLCFNGNAYKPNKLPEQGTDDTYSYDGDCVNWYNVKGIRSCLCVYDGEVDKLIQLLTELYFGNPFVKFFSEYWVELSSGTGTGVVGLGSVGGGGYLMYAYFSGIKWLI